MDAIKLLRAGHYQIRDLLEDLCDTDADASQVRKDLLAQVATALDVHSRIGDEILYPVVREAAEDDRDHRLLDKAAEEHRAIVDLLMPDLRGTEVDSVQFGGRAKVLRTVVEFHIREEEGELFPRIKKLLSEADRHALGDRLLQRKQELMGDRARS